MEPIGNFPHTNVPAIEIIRHLPADDIVNVCKTGNHILYNECQRPEVWERLLKEDYKVTMKYTDPRNEYIFRRTDPYHKLALTYKNFFDFESYDIHYDDDESLLYDVVIIFDKCVMKDDMALVSFDPITNKRNVMKKGDFVEQISIPVLIMFSKVDGTHIGRTFDV